MKKIILAAIVLLSAVSYGQYRWEVSGGPTFSNLSIEGQETNSSTGFYFNAGYGYVTGVRAKTSFVFSIDLLQRKSEIESGAVSVPSFEYKALQVGFNPKFRYLFNSGKDRFRPFINVGPSFRLNLDVEYAGQELEAGEEYEQLVIGGVYGIGFSQMIGEMFDIMAEVGAMNDFTDNLIDVDSKFFDIYARVGVRFRIYDARR
ncbi:outer membrane beta-barrel protein [Aquimarina brevivitae]|uniref:Outer membrane protein with beta-barrel domain n=1 Tax=Aquimarina brevivitae TaxID=323412 RepID=A0A4Q7P4N9_9FLAO|nr:outer membrane beta-barrel protein [Aquimarina brevivitae]RZS93662.1 outer membrane protein with beta-barrel domain [Aquimarina brevivitae]